MSFFLIIYVEEKCGLYSIVHLIIFPVFIVILLGELDDCSNTEKNNGLHNTQPDLYNVEFKFPRGVSGDDQLRALHMTQIRVRSRIVHEVNTFRLNRTPFMDVDIQIAMLFSAFRYVPDRRQVEVAAAYMKKHGVDLDIDDGEHYETRTMIDRFVNERNQRLISDVFLAMRKGIDSDKAIAKLVSH